MNLRVCAWFLNCAIATGSLIEPDDALRFMQVAVNLNRGAQNLSDVSHNASEKFGWCKPWCHEHSETWKTKCAWRTSQCKACSACVKDHLRPLRRAVHGAVHAFTANDSAGACKPWCHGHSNSWSTKCAWITNTCSACPACARGSLQNLREALRLAAEHPRHELKAIYHCDTWCHEHTADWNTKCAWNTYDCRACSACSQNSSQTLRRTLHGRRAAGSSCRRWCHFHRQIWSQKCAWESNQCSGCAACMHGEYESLHQAVARAVASDVAAAEELSDEIGDNSDYRTRLQQQSAVQREADTNADEINLALRLNENDELETAFLDVLEERAISIDHFQLGDGLPELRDNSGQLLSNTDEPREDQFPIEISFKLVRTNAPVGGTSPCANVSFFEEMGGLPHKLRAARAPLTATMADVVAMGDAPSAPGCYVYTSSGCREFTLGPKPAEWTLVTKEGSSSSRRACEKRKHEYNRWCKITDARMLFVAPDQRSETPHSAAEAGFDDVAAGNATSISMGDSSLKEEEGMHAKHMSERLLARELLRELIAPDLRSPVQDEAMDLADELSQQTAEKLAAELLKPDDSANHQEEGSHGAIRNTRMQASEPHGVRIKLLAVASRQNGSLCSGVDCEIGGSPAKNILAMQDRDPLAAERQHEATVSASVKPKHAAPVNTSKEQRNAAQATQSMAGQHDAPGSRPRKHRRAGLINKSREPRHSVPVNKSIEGPHAVLVNESNETKQAFAVPEVVDSQHAVVGNQSDDTQQASAVNNSINETTPAPKAMYSISKEAWSDLRSTRQSLLHLDRRKFLFCNVPLVANMEFLKMLLRLDGWHASHWNDVLSNYDPAREHMWLNLKKDKTFFNQLFAGIAEGWFKAVFLRDPVSRFVAAYQSKVKAGYFSAVLGYDKDPSIDEFVEGLELGKFDMRTDSQLRPQSYTCALNETIELYDFVGDFKLADHDAHAMLTRLGGAELAADTLDHGWGANSDMRLFRTPRGNTYDAQILRSENEGVIKVQKNTSLVTRIQALYSMDYDLLRRAKAVRR